MPDRSKADRRTGAQPRLKPGAKRERKQQLLTHSIPSMARSIAEAVVIKDEDVFLITEHDGSVPLGGHHGFGLYYHDCRFLNGYEITLNGQPPDPLVASGVRGFCAVMELTNPFLHLGPRRVLPKQTIGIKWERVIAFRELALEERLTFTNYGTRKVELPVELTIESGFEDIFTVRGLLGSRRGRTERPSWRKNVLRFMYDGADDIYRSLHVHFSHPPARKGEGRAAFRLKLDAGKSVELMISLTLAESHKAAQVRRESHARSAIAQVKAELHRKHVDWAGQHTEVRSSSRTLSLVLNRSLRDLRVLRSNLEHREYFAAGTPWFATLFGRDSVITAMETLAYHPAIAEQTLRLLAEFQGHHEDEWRDEQPGKILHELRVGELAHVGEIPHTPYYGTVDATPLFLILVGEHARWTGSLKLFRELRDNIELALRWIDDYGDLDGDGYVEYRSQSNRGLVNQGWKDSGDAIINADGSIAQPPIALVEVQAYVYRAKKEMAELYRRAGEDAMAHKLEHAAEQLRARFNRDFWMADEGVYGLALEGGNRLAEVVSSNPGHALWAGIADPDKSRATCERLMRPDMFAGWGIRTLSSDEVRFNPIGYHLGTVWPHDNAIIFAGFRHYGFDQPARRLFTALLEASLHFTNNRLPEAFAGLDRETYGVPVKYPVACHPQAWAAGAIPFFLQTALGLQPNAFDARLDIVRPILPEMVEWVELKGMRVGRGSVDLRFEQRQDDVVTVEVLKAKGIEVVVEPANAAGRAKKERKIA